jgi:hypothetical protein
MVAAYIAELPVRCANAAPAADAAAPADDAVACAWTGPLRALDEHLRSACSAESVACPNDAAGCGASFRRRDAGAHAAVCAHEPVACAVAGCAARVAREALDAHMCDAAAAHVTLLLAAMDVTLRRAEAAERRADEAERRAAALQAQLAAAQRSCMPSLAAVAAAAAAAGAEQWLQEKEEAAASARLAASLAARPAPAAYGSHTAGMHPGYGYPHLGPSSYGLLSYAGGSTNAYGGYASGHHPPGWHNGGGMQGRSFVSQRAAHVAPPVAGKCTSRGATLPATSGASASSLLESSKTATPPSSSGATTSRSATVPAPRAVPADGATSSLEEKRQLLGPRLYPLVAVLQPDRQLASKITGMLLEMDNDELLLLLESRDALAAKVEAAMQALRQHGIID